MYLLVSDAHEPFEPTEPPAPAAPVGRPVHCTVTAGMKQGVAQAAPIAWALL
jgi:hypothetical protein